MAHLPVVSGAELIRALGRIGYIEVRSKGSHRRLCCPSDPTRRPTTVPLHRELKRGTLLSILADAGLTVDQLREFLKK
jgi:predicted RNA binding protein YcfA (HicA-like mRNA interferase family)